MRPLGDIWIYVADTSCRGYSPLYDSICRYVAGRDDVLDLVEQAPPRGHNPVLLLAVVHELVLRGAEHELAAVYTGTSDAEPGPLFADLCLAQPDVVLDLLATRSVNTNEVGRAAVLGPALTAVAARHGEPLAHLDVGCSAGLNLLADRYRLDYGPAGATGPADAEVRIDCTVVGGEPPIAEALPEVVARIGLDREPVDVQDDEQVRWQLACVWPDTGRMPRTRAALAAARSAGLVLHQGDAIEDVGAMIDLLPSGATAVVSTSWVVGYFSLEQRAAFAAALAEAGRTRRVAWVSAESAGVVDAIPGGATAPRDALGVEASVLGLVTFDGAAATPELLGFVHPHGSSIDWRANSRQ